MFKNLIVKPALFAVYVALVFSFIGCVNPAVPETASTIDENWTAVSSLPGNRARFESLVLNNGDILIMGGADSTLSYLNDIWLSSDRGSNWNEVTNQAPWDVRENFQAVLLPNNDILVMGGRSIIHLGVNPGYPSTTLAELKILNDVWLSSDSGMSWSQIPASNPWPVRYDFQSVVLNNGDILVMGGAFRSLRVTETTSAYYVEYLNSIYLSKDSGRSWNQIPASNHWSPRRDFQAVVLANNDILVMGGEGANDIWRSSDGGTNWSEITNSAPWGNRYSFQTRLLNNGNILLIGGTGSKIINSRSRTVLYGGVWLSADGGTSWNSIPAASDDSRYASGRYDFQALVLENDEVLIMGGSDGGFLGDVWMRQF